MADHTGVSFDGVHSYDDWGLRLKSVSIGIPAAKTYYVDVPGMDGQLDLTEAMHGGVKYDNRTMEFAFNAVHTSYTQWAALISTIINAINGKDIDIILDIDQGYYYRGRVSIDTKKTNEVTSEIVISGYCEPYKLDIRSMSEPWLWDPFSFVDGVAMSTSQIEINSTSDWQEVRIIGYPWNDTPTFVCNTAGTITLMVDGVQYALSEGSTTLYDVEIKEGEQTFYFKGTGTVTIVYRGGRL